MAFSSVVFAVILYAFSIIPEAKLYEIGVGIADVTGPAAELNMMGYAKSEQKTAGIHLRLFSRAFIIKDTKNSVVFVSVDVGMVSQIVKTRVAQILSQKYPGLYDETNIVLSATHTHSGPGGYHQYVLFVITALGFNKQSFEAIVNGIVQSVDLAHQNLQPGTLWVSQGILSDASINRSPTSYLKNPEAEQKRYSGNVDKEMTVLKFKSIKGHDLGMISWFAVHATSMNNTNLLISGDNKGYASQLFEADMNGGAPPGKGPFVAAFAQSNEGDVSPNTAGPKCLTNGKDCDIVTGNCKSKDCVAFGPGRTMLQSTKIIARMQYNKAKELFDGTMSEVTGPVDFIHQYVDMEGLYVNVNGKMTKTCRAAMGFSFAAGTTDGPGSFSFTQGDTTGNPFWNAVRNIISKPSKADKACHAPKPILLNTGRMTFPYPWQPSIVETQILRLGNFVVVPLPGEFTTMSGRRVRDSVRLALDKDGVKISEKNIVIAGLANTYADYIVTYEEYQAQRYEAASTLYGPHTLLAFQQQYERLASALAQGLGLAAGPRPPYLVSKLMGFVTGVVYDNPGIGSSFGDVLSQPKDKYYQGDTVEVSFVSANPRNDLRQGSSFLRVEQLDPKSNSWLLRYTDAHWDTEFHWIRTSTVLAQSKAVIKWFINGAQEPGTYRIVHEGNWKQFLIGKIRPFVGRSRSFTVRERPSTPDTAAYRAISSGQDADSSINVG